MARRLRSGDRPIGDGAVSSLTVELEVDLDCCAEPPRATGGNAVASRGEPGCRCFELRRGLDRPGVCVLWEVCDDLAALSAHHASGPFARWRERSADGPVRAKRSLRCELVD